VPWPEFPDRHILFLLGAGVLIALVAWLPLALRRLPLTLPILCIGIGVAIFALPGVALRPDPLAWPEVTEWATEFVVIIALMGAGLKLDTPFHVRRWALTWRLLAIAMPLTIAGILVAGLWAGLPMAAALLLAAALAPTDPVLASDVQVGPPSEGEEDRVRFALTSEAGLNDGLAFPFVYLAVALVATAPGWLGEWLLVDVLWRLAIGLLGGWLVGRAFGWLTFQVPASSALALTGDGLVAVSATLVAYALTEIAHGYGFLAVFVAALTMRESNRTHAFHCAMHDLVEQVERLAMMALLLLFGGALAGGLLAPLHWQDWVLAALVLLVIRPAAGMLALVGSTAPAPERLVIAVFGIRGVGTFYYIAWALNEARFADAERLWAIAGLVVLLSVLLHGLTVTPAMDRLDRRRRFLESGRLRARAPMPHVGCPE
jgi:NhaP-type Na+/H+ or K+/H+ antiporter